MFTDRKNTWQSPNSAGRDAGDATPRAGTKSRTGKAGPRLLPIRVLSSLPLAPCPGFRELPGI